MQNLRLFHISEEGHIQKFVPRTSPQHYTAINGDVVFAISNERVHNYLLPRNCPRICYWQNKHTTQSDIAEFFAGTSTQNVIVIEDAWLKAVNDSKLYCYEFAVDDFELLDENAGYYIAYNAQVPIKFSTIDKPMEMLRQLGVTVVNIPALKHLAERITKSTLSFSLIRLRNSTK